MMRAFFKYYSKAKAFSSRPPHPESFEQSESIKAHVIPADICRKLPMATAKAACVHPRATFWP